MPSPFDALVALPHIVRSTLYGLLSRKDPFVREVMGGAEPTDEEITGAAGGLPVTGVGQIFIRKELERAAKQALSRMQPEVVDWMRRSPTKFVVEPVTREHISSVLPESEFSSAAGYMQPGPGVYTARVTRPDAGLIGHEFAHAAQYAIGKERRGIPGTSLKPWGVSGRRRHGYSKKALPEELAADVLAGPERMEYFGARIWDEPQFQRYIKENYPQLSTPPVQEIINEAGDVIPRVGSPPPGTSPQWKLTKNAPPWLRRSFEGGKREVPLQGRTPERLLTESPGLVKKPVTYEIPESADELAPLLEQLGGSYGPRKMPPVSGGAPTPFDKLPAKSLPPLSVGDFVEFKSPKGGMTRGKIRDIDTHAKTAWIFPVDRSLITDVDAAAITIPLADIVKLPPVSGGAPSPFEKLPKNFLMKLEGPTQFDTLKQLIDIAEGKSPVKVYHGTTKEAAHNILKEGVRLPASGAALAQEVAKKYEIPYKEFIEKVLPSPSLGYGTEVSRLSTAAPGVASRWAKHLPRGEVLSSMDTYARLYKEAKRLGITIDAVFDKARNVAKLRGKRFSYETAADILRLPSKYPVEGRGALMSFETDVRNIPKYVRAYAKSTLKHTETAAEAIPEWAENYIDIKVSPRKLKKPRIEKYYDKGIRDEFTPPVGGGAPSPFDKFTSKGLPIPKEFAEYHEKLAKAGPHEKKYIEKGLPVPKQTGKSTQDILGRLRESTGYPTQRMSDDFFDDVTSIREAYEFTGVPSAHQPKPRNLLEAIRETGQRWALTDEEVAALIRRGEQMGTNALDALRPPPEPEQIRAWVRSVLGP